MTEHPIIFSTPRVRAILDGRKTQTRRVIELETDWRFVGFDEEAEGDVIFSRPNRVVMGHEVVTEYTATRVPWRVGDTLWVRETFCYPEHPVYRADFSERDLAASEAMRRRFPDIAAAYPDSRWSPSIHMPRALARLFLHVIGIRVERLQDITLADAYAEGARPTGGHEGLRYAGSGTWISDGHPSYRDAMTPDVRAEFACSWDSHRGMAPWSWNPWVWVIEFERVEA